MSEMNEQEEGRAERRRHVRHRGLIAVAASGAFVGAMGLILAMDGSADEERIGLILALAGAGVALVAGVLAWTRRPHGEPARGPGGWRDHVQRTRRSHMLMMPFLMLIAVGVGTPAVARIVAGQGEGADWVWAGAIAIHALVAPAMLLGLDGEARKQKRMLDDELSRALRGQAMAFGFLVLTAGVLAVFLLGLWRPALAITVLPLALFAAGASGLWRFVWLDREAEGLG